MIQILKYFAITLSMLTIVGCSTESDKKIHTFDQLSGKKIVIQQGTTFEQMLKEKYPQYDLTSVSTSFEVFKAVVSGAADYGVEEDIPAIQMMANGLSIDTSRINMAPVPMGAIFNKRDAALQSKFNAFIDSLDQCGALEKIREKWFTSVTPSSIPVPEAKATDGEPLVAVTEADYPPFNMKVGDKISGFDVELMALFADYIGRPLTVSAMQFDHLIPYIADGKADLAIAGISITDERAKKVLFSKPYNHTYTTIVFVKKPGKNN